jgi:hypothetical protein
MPNLLLVISNIVLAPSCICYLPGTNTSCNTIGCSSGPNPACNNPFLYLYGDSYVGPYVPYNTIYSGYSGPYIYLCPYVDSYTPSGPVVYYLYGGPIVGGFFYLAASFGFLAPHFHGCICPTYVYTRNYTNGYYDGHYYNYTNCNSFGNIPVSSLGTSATDGYAATVCCNFCCGTV